MARIIMSQKSEAYENAYHIMLDCGTCMWIESDVDPHFSEVECANRLCVIHHAPNNSVHADAGDSADSSGIVNASAESTSQAESAPTQRG